MLDSKPVRVSASRLSAPGRGARSLRPCLVSPGNTCRRGHTPQAPSDERHAPIRSRRRHVGLRLCAAFRSAGGSIAVLLPRCHIPAASHEPRCRVSTCWLGCLPSRRTLADPVCCWRHGTIVVKRTLPFARRADTGAPTRARIVQRHQSALGHLDQVLDHAPLPHSRCRGATARIKWDSGTLPSSRMTCRSAGLRGLHRPRSTTPRVAPSLFSSLSTSSSFSLSPS